MSAFHPSTCAPPPYARIFQNTQPLIFRSIGAVLIVAGGVCYSLATWREEGSVAAAVEGERGGRMYSVMDEGQVMR